MKLEEIEQFIKSVLEEVTGETIIDYDLPLLEEELLDSMSILYLVSEMEEKYGLQVPMEDVVEDNFKNIRSITNYVYERIKSDNRGRV